MQIFYKYCLYRKSNHLTNENIRPFDLANMVNKVEYSLYKHQKDLNSLQSVMHRAVNLQLNDTYYLTLNTTSSPWYRSQGLPNRAISSSYLPFNRRA